MVMLTMIKKLNLRIIEADGLLSFLRLWQNIGGCFLWLFHRKMTFSRVFYFFCKVVTLSSLFYQMSKSRIHLDAFCLGFHKR